MATYAQLRELAEAWRNKAARIEKQYSAAAPNLVLHCKTALETCAEDLERLLVRDAVPATAQPQPQPNPEP